jgi:hypothetical protein
MENGTKIQIPEIGKQTMSTQREERKAAGVGLLAKLGLGGGAGAGGAGAGGLAAGGGLLAGKAGVVALILAGSSVAAGIGMLTMGGGSNAPRAGAALFARAEGEAAPADSAAGAGAAAQAAASAGSVSGSLDNFNSANKGAVVDPYAPAKVEDASNPAADQPQDAPAAVPDNSTTQSPGTTPPAAKGPAPKMVKSSGFGSPSGGGGSSASGGGVAAGAAGAGAKSNVAGSALAGSSALRGGGIRGAAGARRSAIMRGGGAAGQLKAHSSALRGNLGSSHVSSAGSGSVMDGAGSAGALGGGGGAIAAGGQGAGGKGVDSSPGASVSKNLKDVSPPPAPVEKAKNVTSYQKEMMIAMGASMAAMALLFISGMLSDSAKKATVPGAAAALLAKAKNVALMATALAAVATGIGLWLMMQKGQMMQGAMIAAVGGIMTFQAGKAWLTGREAASEAELEAKGAADQAATTTNGKLNGFKATGVDAKGMATYSNPTTGQTATMQLQARPPVVQAAPTGAQSPWVGKADPTIVAGK